MLNLLRRLAGLGPGQESPAPVLEEAVAPEAIGADPAGTATPALELADDAPAADAVPAAAAAVPCPYCRAPLGPPPPRTRRCPSCRQQVIVRRVEGETAYLTETEAAVLEAQRHRQADERAWSAARAHWLALARSVRAPAELIQQVAAMPLTDRAVEGARAVYRTAADQAVREARLGGHWVQVGRVRAIEADALYEDLGRPLPPPDDIVAVYREGRAAVLHSLAAHSPVAELAGSSCCKACRSDDGTLGTIAAELRRPRLPHPGCPRGLCGCDWVLAVAAPRGAKRRRRPRRPTASGAAGASGETTTGPAAGVGLAPPE